jgi:prolyl oligopeptidase PreP (S9A serine peptidase family)
VSLNSVFDRLAVPGIRGGGEQGRAWQEAAATIRRQIAYDDFQYAARYLIERGLSAKGKITSTGSSNGMYPAPYVLTID